MITSKDELNNLHSEQINKYFSEMELPDEEIAKRIDLCEELDYLFFVMWTLASAIDKTEGGISEEQAEYLKNYGYQGYMDVLSDKGYEDEKFYPEYVQDTINQLVDTTVNHINEKYYTSEKRSLVVGENQANSIGNHDIEQKALKQGMKYKTWMTMKDERVRHTHRMVDEIKIGIFDMFHVGMCEMLYPCDEVNGTPEETVNCRCVCKYSRG